MNNNEKSIPKNENLDDIKEEKANNVIPQKKIVNDHESNINEEPKNKVTVKVEDNNKEMEKLNEEKIIPIEYMNYLNDYYNSQEYNSNDERPKNVITMKDIIGTDAKKEININIMNESFNNFFPGKVSTRSYGPIKAYAANTNQGIVRDYNEDRVSIIININQPNFSKNKKANWPKASYFSIFDGHGGNKCAEFLRDNLLKLICDNDFFPTDIEKAIKFGFSEADRLFLEIAVKDGKLLDSSGSCGLILLIIDNKIYIANVGDSRCIISMNNGKVRKDVTRDHKPNYPYEKKRIITNGGKIYQTQTPLSQKVETNNNNNSDESFTNNENINSNLILLGPHRVFPGSLSVSRTIGDAASKLSSLGGNPKVVISEPDIYSFELAKEDIDFIILGCDGIYDQLTSEDVIQCAWKMIDFSKKYNSKEKINNNEKEEEEKDEIDLFTTCAHIVDFILKVSMSRKSFDNVTCLIVAFKDLINNDLNQNHTNEIPFLNKNEKKDKLEKPTIILEDKKETKIPRLIISKTASLLTEDEKLENKRNGNSKKKINIDKIQIKSIEKDEKNNLNKKNYKLNKNIKLFGNNIENLNNNINSGELSHRVISNNLLKEFKYKANKSNENENIENINKNKNELSLSSAKIMKKSKSIESIIDRTNKNHNINNITDKKMINNPINNFNFINNSEEKNISTKKERLNISKKLFMNKKIKPLFIENKLNKNKYKNNTLRIATISPKNNSQSRIGGSLSKHGPVLSDLNLYSNKKNLKEIHPISLANNIPKITNINTITLKNSPKGKLSLNDLLSIGSNKIYSYRNKYGNKLKSLNKKSISFYNKCNFNDFANNQKIGGEKISLQKNQISKFDLFSKKSENSTGSYANIKNTNMGKANKYQFSNDDKHKDKMEKPINLCPIYQNDYKINGGKKKYSGSNTKVKTLVHNLTENLLSQNKRNGIPVLSGKNKIYNNINSIKKLNLI